MNLDGQAKHYLTDRQGFESTARYWTEVRNSFVLLPRFFPLSHLLESQKGKLTKRRSLLRENRFMLDRILPRGRTLRALQTRDRHHHLDRRRTTRKRKRDWRGWIGQM